MKPETSNEKQINRLLTEKIASMADESPPVNFTESVMQRIQPKRLSRWRCIIGRLQTPFAVICLRPLTAGAVILLFAGLLFVYQSSRLPSTSSPPLQELANLSCGTVNFRLDLASAEKVAVIGSFNHWQPEGYNLHRNLTDGTWQLTVPIQAGRHTYAFLVDDKYIIPDPLALWEQEDGFGNRNSILTINNGCPDENRI